jgi:hypothetical protein
MSRRDLTAAITENKKLMEDEEEVINKDVVAHLTEAYKKRLGAKDETICLLTF